MTNAEHFSESKRIHQMFEQPDAWIKETLPKFREVSSTSSEDLKHQQEIRWIQETKMNPEDTHVTVVMPIHNESKCLPSVLGALMLSDIPDSAHIQFIFFLNGCTDNNQSHNTVRQFLTDLGEIHDMYHPIFERNPDINTPASKVKVNNLEFLLVESSLASKTHAISIANELAHQRGDKITINIDANNWPDPYAIRSIISTTHESIEQEKAYVTGGHSIYSYRPSFIMNLRQRSQRVFERPKNLDSKALHGWLMAWDTAWLQSIGGLPEVACDDYALSLETRKSGREVIYDQGAQIWGYQPNSFVDHMRVHARMIRDRIQIHEHYSDDLSMTTILKDDEYFMGPVSKRIEHLYEEIRLNPIKTPIYVFRALRWELARFYGKWLYNRNPLSQTWHSIRSTK